MPVQNIYQPKSSCSKPVFVNSLSGSYFPINSMLTCSFSKFTRISLKPLLYSPSIDSISSILSPAEAPQFSFLGYLRISPRSSSPDNGPFCWWLEHPATLSSPSVPPHHPLFLWARNSSSCGSTLPDASIVRYTGDAATIPAARIPPRISRSVRGFLGCPAASQQTGRQGQVDTGSGKLVSGIVRHTGI